MACFSVSKIGFLTIDDILDDIVAEMTGNVSLGATNSTPYFDLKIDATGTPTFASNRVIILESNFAVDPLANAAVVGSSTITTCDPGWRICFNAEGTPRNKLHVHLGTELQLANDGQISRLSSRGIGTGSNVSKEPAGNMSDEWDFSNGASPNPNDFNQFWLNRDATDPANEGAYPMSYMLTMTNRGMFLAIWEGSQEENPQGLYPYTSDNPNPDGFYGYSPLRWLLIQRPVDRLTGHVRGGGALRQNNDPAAERSRCPVVAISGFGNPPDYRKTIVREVDVLVPSRKKVVSIQSEDQPAMINPYQQQSLTEDGEFIVTFINAISTPRFRYADELDMVGTVSAKVIGAGTSIVVRVYDETDDGTPTGVPVYREYTALYSTERHGNGMRLMVLTKMGVDPNNPTEVGPAALARNVAVENSHIWYTPPSL